MKNASNEGDKTSSKIDNDVDNLSSSGRDGPAAVAAGDRDALASKLRLLETSVSHSKTRRWEIRERIREIRAQLSANAEVQHASHAVLDRLKVRTKLFDVLEERRALDQLREKIALLEQQQQQCLQRLHTATGGELPDGEIQPNLWNQRAVPAVFQPQNDAAMLDCMKESIVQLQIQSAEQLADAEHRRAALTQEHMLVNDRLRHLRMQHDHSGKPQPDEPTSEQMYEMAAAIDSLISDSLATANSSIKQLEVETHWLEDGHTEHWRLLRHTVAERIKQLDDIRQDTMSLKASIAAAEAATELRALQDPLNSLDGQAIVAGDKIYEEVVLQLVNETAEYVHASCAYSDHVVRQSILSSVLSGSGAAVQTPHKHTPYTEAEEVHRTMLHAIAYEFGQETSRNLTAVGQIAVAIPTQHISHVGDGGVERFREWVPMADSIVQARNNDGHRWIPGERIMMERRISNGMHIVAAPEKLIMPALLGRLTVLETSSATALHNSMIVAGGSSGSFCVWTVPWSHDERILLTAVSPKLPGKERSPIEEIRFSLDCTSQVLTRDAKGAIRIWSIEPITKVGTKRVLHTPSMFPQSYQQFAPVVPACMAYLPFETLLFPQSPPLPKQVVQTPDTQAIRVCFESSTTFALRQPSVLIALSNGDVVKFNTDYDVASSAAPLLNPAVTPALELANPLGVKNGIEAFSADPQRRGNKVWRERFNFHRTTLLFLSTAGELDEWIVTVDADGILALWETWSHRAIISVIGFHRPNRTCRIDLTLPTFTPVSEEVAVIVETMLPQECTSDGSSVEQMVWDVIQTGYLISTDVDDQGLLVQCFGKASLTDPTRGTIHKVWVNPETNTVARCAVAEAHVTEHNGSVIDIQLTSTRENLCFLIEYSAIDQAGKVAAISTIDLRDLAFTFPRCTFAIAEDNKILDWALGPLMREPLTFYGFILSDHSLRIVSLVTGQVLRVIALRTFVPRNILQTKPQFVRVCRRQKVLVLGSPTSRQLFCCRFGHDYDGITVEEAADLRCLAYFQQLAASDPKHYVTSAMIDSQQRDATMDERMRVNNSILDTIHLLIDHVVDSCTQQQAIELLLGEGPLGAVYPTTWLFPPPNTKQAKLPAGMMLAFESDSSDEPDTTESEHDHPITSTTGSSRLSEQCM